MRISGADADWANQRNTNEAYSAREQLPLGLNGSGTSPPQIDLARVRHWIYFVRGQISYTPPTPGKTLPGWGVYKRGGPYKFLPRGGGSKYTHPPVPPKMPHGQKKGGGGRGYIISPWIFLFKGGGCGSGSTRVFFWHIGGDICTPSLLSIRGSSVLGALRG